MNLNLGTLKNQLVNTGKEVGGFFSRANKAENSQKAIQKVGANVAGSNIGGFVNSQKQIKDMLDSM